MTLLDLKILVVLSVLCGPSTPTGRPWTMPPQISPYEIEVYARWLHLSAAQRLALGHHYESYLIEYNTLLDKARQTNTVPANTFEEYVASLEAARHEKDTLARRVAELDRGLFSSVAPILTDKQTVRIERVIAHRRVHAAHAALDFLQRTGRPLVDLVETLDSVPLTEDQAEQMESVIFSYQTQLANRVAELDRQASSLPLAIAQSLAAQGVQSFSEAGKVGQQVWPEMAAKSLRIAGLIDDLTKESATRIAAALADDEAADAWTLAYHLAVYPRLTKLIRLRCVLVESARCLEHTSLDDADTVNAITSELATTLRLTIDEMMQLDDAANARHSPDVSYAHGLAMTYQEVLHASVTRANALLNETKDALKRALSTSSFNAWEKAFLQAHNGPVSNVTHSPDLQARGPLPPACHVSHGIHLKALVQLFNAPITPTDLSSAWRQYDTCCDAIEKREDHNTDALSETQLRAVDACDEDLLTTLSLAWQADTRASQFIDLVRCVRYNQTRSAGIHVAGAAQLDIVVLLGHVTPLSELSDDVLSMLTSHCRRVTDIVRRRHRAHTVLRQMRTSSAPREAIIESMRTVQSLNGELCRANLGARHELRDHLAPSTFEAFSQSFDNIAYSEVLADEERRHALCERVLRQGSLDLQQRERVLECVLHYREEYSRLTTGLLDAAAYATWWWTDEQGELWPGGVTQESLARLANLRRHREILNQSAKIQLEYWLHTQEDHRSRIPEDP